MSLFGLDLHPDLSVERIVPIRRTITNLYAVRILIVRLTRYSRFKVNEKELRKFADKYEEIKSIYKAVENIDSTYFEFNKKYIKQFFASKLHIRQGNSVFTN